MAVNYLEITSRKAPALNKFGKPQLFFLKNNQITFLIYQVNKVPLFLESTQQMEEDLLGKKKTKKQNGHRPVGEDEAVSCPSV